MPKGSIDDLMTFNKKIVRAGNEAVGAWVRLIALSNAHLSDGVVSLEQALLIAPRRVLARLIDAGLLHEENGAVRIHDFHDHNERSEDVRARRKFERERKAAARSGQGRDSSGRITSKPHEDSGARPAGQPPDVRPDNSRRPNGRDEVSHRSSSSSSSSSPLPTATGAGRPKVEVARLPKGHWLVDGLAKDPLLGTEDHGVLAALIVAAGERCARGEDDVREAAEESLAALGRALGSRRGVGDVGAFVVEVATRLLRPGGIEAHRARLVPRGGVVSADHEETERERLVDEYMSLRAGGEKQ